MIKILDKFNEHVESILTMTALLNYDIYNENISYHASKGKMHEKTYRVIKNEMHIDNFFRLRFDSSSIVEISLMYKNNEGYWQTKDLIKAPNEEEVKNMLDLLIINNNEGN
ncbi:gp30 [Bacillus phage G]|uniref:Gp30 n=1 Tax=Bacillus phage G TaxID=2884420 RepID=G3MBA0_9CAUD|nr:gp30 [Bacillus phage G]AEO93301.1 gp30 [Bacillus phage G]